jgi:hypothetical protein
VTLLGNGLGLCGLEDSRKMLTSLSKVVNPNGLLVASSRDPKITDNPQHLAYHKRNREIGKPIGLLRFRVNYDGDKGEWFDFYMVEPENIEDFLNGTGWVLERLIRDDDPKQSGYGVVLRNRK